MNTAASINQTEILRRSISIDLEVGPRIAKISAFAAVAFDPETPSLVANANVDADFPKPEAFCQRFDHVIGHNILRHDLQHLAAASSRFAALSRAAASVSYSLLSAVRQSQQERRHILRSYVYSPPQHVPQ